MYLCGRAGVAQTEHCAAAHSIVGSSPTNAFGNFRIHLSIEFKSDINDTVWCKYVSQNGSTTMLTIKRPVGVTPEVNLRIMQATKHKTCKQGIQMTLKSEGRLHQKSKTGIKVGPTRRT